MWTLVLSAEGQVLGAELRDVEDRCGSRAPLGVQGKRTYRPPRRLVHERCRQRAEIRRSFRDAAAASTTAMCRGPSVQGAAVTVRNRLGLFTAALLTPGGNDEGQ